MDSEIVPCFQLWVSSFHLPPFRAEHTFVEIYNTKLLGPPLVIVVDVPASIIHTFFSFFFIWYLLVCQKGTTLLTTLNTHCLPLCTCAACRCHCKLYNRSNEPGEAKESCQCSPQQGQGQEGQGEGKDQTRTSRRNRPQKARADRSVVCLYYGTGGTSRGSLE